MRSSHMSIGENFRECLREFTKQPLEFLLPGIENISSIDEMEKVVKALLATIKSDNLSAFWMISAIWKNFLRKASNSYNEPDFITMVRLETVEQLLSELTSQTHGLDFDLITRLSAENYESQVGEGLYIALFPYLCTIDPENPLLNGHALLFSKNQRYLLTDDNLHALRKQLNMTKGGCLLVGCEKSEHSMKFFSFGIGDASLLSKIPSIALLGHSKWNYRLPYNSKPECLLRYVGGRLLLPNIPMNTSECQRLRKALESSYDGARSLDSFSLNIEEVLMKALDVAKSQKKGTIFILTDTRTAALECWRLCMKYRRGTVFDRAYYLGDPCINDAIMQLTAIDGALILDLNGRCWACGVILDGDACTEGDMARGARYNSTNNYVECTRAKYPKSPVAAIVASEDGMLNFFPEKTGSSA